MYITPLLICSECVSLSVNFYRKSEGVRMRGHETSSSAQRDVHEFLSFSHRKWMLLDYFRSFRKYFTFFVLFLNLINIKMHKLIGRLAIKGLLSSVSIKTE